MSADFWLHTRSRVFRGILETRRLAQGLELQVEASSRRGSNTKARRVLCPKTCFGMRRSVLEAVLCPPKIRKHEFGCVSQPEFFLCRTMRVKWLRHSGGHSSALGQPSRSGRRTALRYIPHAHWWSNSAPSCIRCREKKESREDADKFQLTVRGVNHGCHSVDLNSELVSCR